MAFTPIDPNKAEVRITGEAPNYGLDFYIPRGERGAIGPTGPQGPAVPTNLSIGTIEVGPAAPGTVGPQGLQGLKGDPGGIIQTDLLTSDLNLLYANPGAYSQPNSANATLALGYPYNGFIGSILILKRGTDRVTQIAYPQTGSTTAGNLFYVRVNGASGFNPWRVYNSTRIDQTAGRVIYQWDDVNNRDQLIYGDTGWRDVSASLMNGWTGTSLWIRRIDYTVYIRAYSMIGTAATLNKFYTLPTGFNRSPSGTEYLTAADGFTVIGVESAGGVLAFSNTANRFAGAFGNFTPYTTTDAWPTTLPGTAVAAIPNT
jgi:hypothetical protein